MLLRRFFERARTCSSNDAYKQTCLCTTAKRDSFYDDPIVRLTKSNERHSTEQHPLGRKDKSRQLMRQTDLDESDVEDDIGIVEKLRRASSQSPANIPMLVVVSFHPDAKGLQNQQIGIQRGFPVNAQYILNEWLFIKTADNEEGFVPYLCCRPVFRRQSMKSIENCYKPYDFELNNKIQQIKSSSSTLTPPTNKKLSLSTNFQSPSYLFQKTISSHKKRQDVTSSSCGGDSGVSDCESSSQNQQNLDISNKTSTRLSNIRSLRSLSNPIKKTGLIVQDIPVKKTIKSQLLISNNSAFTQIVKRNSRQESPQRPLFHSNNRSFRHEQELSSSSFTNNIRRSYDETTNLSVPSSSAKYFPDKNNIISSPYIRRTPYVRRSLPYHIKSSSSPDPFKIIKEHQPLRNIVLAERSLPLAIIQKKPLLERHFSDLSLNQIENDSLSPSTPLLVIQKRPCLSYSTSTSSSSSSSSTTSSSSDGNSIPFIHIQMNSYRTGRIPVVYASSNITNNNNTNNTIPSTKSNSFIHNVSITV